MISLNKSHPDFDMQKEVECMIPKLPYAVEMRYICSDLGIDTDQLSVILRNIQKKHRVHYQPGVADMAVGSPRLSWAAMGVEADKYYQNVYGEDFDNGI